VTATPGNSIDLAIVGGGPAGYVAALRATQLGASVVLVEKDRVGGTCLNRGCIPTKALIRSAEALVEARDGAKLGVELASQPVANFSRMMARKNEVVNSLVSGVESLLAAGRVRVEHGNASLARAGDIWRVATADADISARRVILATGSTPARLPVPGSALANVLTSTEALDLDHIPASIVIAGGNVIGLEFACLFWALGAKVTVVEMLPGLLPASDERYAARMLAILRGRGVDVRLGARVVAIEQAEASLSVRVATAQSESLVQGEIVLLATGQRPFTDDLGLEALGVTMNRRAIAVNEFMETNLPGLYAAGDCTGGQMLAHVASNAGAVAADNALGHRHAVDLKAVPACIWTMPEIAAVGLTERQAKDQGHAVIVGRFPFAALGRALAMGETEGQVRLVCEAGTGVVLGMHVMGPHASDLIAEGALAVRLGLTARQIADTIHAHPTLPEATAEAALSVYGEAIHLRKI
jgi:dihydrolipoamide dehydrogenase